jgi:hypothetical protein
MSVFSSTVFINYQPTKKELNQAINQSINQSFYYLNNYGIYLEIKKKSVPKRP